MAKSLFPRISFVLFVFLMLPLTRNLWTRTLFAQSIENAKVSAPVLNQQSDALEQLSRELESLSIKTDVKLAAPARIQPARVAPVESTGDTSSRISRKEAQLDRIYKKLMIRKKILEREKERLIEMRATFGEDSKSFTNKSRILDLKKEDLQKQQSQFAQEKAAILKEKLGFTSREKDLEQKTAQLQADRQAFEQRRQAFEKEKEAWQAKRNKDAQILDEKSKSLTDQEKTINARAAELDKKFAQMQFAAKSTGANNPALEQERKTMAASQKKLTQDRETFEKQRQDLEKKNQKLERDLTLREMLLTQREKAISGQQGIERAQQLREATLMDREKKVDAVRQDLLYQIQAFRAEKKQWEQELKVRQKALLALFGTPVKR